jgi:two-component system, OmpR family, sensor histidine kinase BaeS
MRSLTLKLTLAFLLIGLTGAVLVAVIIRQRTNKAFDQFILTREQQALVNSLVSYHQANGNWQGLPTNLPLIFNAQPLNGDDRRDSSRGWARFVLVNSDRKVVSSAQPELVGQILSSRDLEGAIELIDNGKVIGWLLLTPTPRQWTPNTPEEQFLRTVNSATLAGALVAGALALVLGSLLAVTMTRSLRELTMATVEIARGKLGLQVQVRSKDELGQLAASFNKMSVDLEQATQARRQMTADIAHELRSPLSVISGYAEALSDGKLPGSPETFGILYLETQYLNRLIDDLRTLSLADAGELSLVLQPVKPHMILERAATRHTVAAQQKGIVLRVDANPGLPEIMLDVERMAQVFDNLILNAFRYTAHGGEILLSAISENGSVRMQVRDTGRGIDPDDIAHVFDRLYRADKSRQQNGESGLGLAIARSIVEAHGGTIDVNSEIGKGATFTISIRIASS